MMDAIYEVAAAAGDDKPELIALVEATLEC